MVENCKQVSPWPAQLTVNESIAHMVASLIFQAIGVPNEGVDMILKAIHDMTVFSETAYRDSKDFANNEIEVKYRVSKDFTNSKIEVKYHGLCQGNGAAPAGLLVISITVVQVLFLDDCDLICIDMVNDESLLETFDKLTANVKSWCMLLIAMVGHIKGQVVVQMPDGSELKIDGEGRLATTEGCVVTPRCSILAKCGLWDLLQYGKALCLKVSFALLLLR